MMIVELPLSLVPLGSTCRRPNVHSQIAAAVFLTLGAIHCGPLRWHCARSAQTSRILVHSTSCGTVGMRFLLLPRLRLFGFIPQLVDIGSVPMLFALLVHV